jgi:hypothetical protein
MAKTSRTRNTKELICPAGEPIAIDRLFHTAMCPSCGVRHFYHEDIHKFVRHVPPPADG